MTETITYPPIWHVPYQRNPFFTGRDEVLDAVHNALHADNAALLPLAATLDTTQGEERTLALHITEEMDGQPF